MTLANFVGKKLQNFMELYNGTTNGNNDTDKKRNKITSAYTLVCARSTQLE